MFDQIHGTQGPVGPANTARFAFLDERARAFFVDWERTADDIVGVLRAEAGRNPYDRGLTDLVGELSTRSDDFRVRWARHDVQFHRTGTKRLHHPGLTLLVYTAEAGTPTHDALTLLAGWAATLDRQEELADS